MKNIIAKKAFPRITSLIAFILLLFIIPFFVSSGYVIQSLIMVFLYAYWSSAFNIISGFAGQLSIGHAAYIGRDAYVTAIMFNEFQIVHG